MLSMFSSEEAYIPLHLELLLYERLSHSWGGKDFYLILVMDMQLGWEVQAVLYVPLSERLGHFTETSFLCHHIRGVVRVVNVDSVLVVHHLLLSAQP